MACTVADSGFLFLVPKKRPIHSTRIGQIASSGTYCLKWESLPQISSKQKGCLIYSRKKNVVQAVAVPIAPSPLDCAEERKRLSEKYGFRQIGEPLPDKVTMRDITESLPKKVFEIDDGKALKSVLISVTSYTLGLFMIAKAPWYLLPLAWAWTGTAVTGGKEIMLKTAQINLLDFFVSISKLGFSLFIYSYLFIYILFLTIKLKVKFLFLVLFVKFFVIGHDCAHKSFSKNKLLEDVVGTLAFLPLIYPYEPWRFKHDRHHAKTNMLHEDTAWQPVWKEEFDSVPALRKPIIFGYGPIRPWMSIAHWWLCHFNLKKFRPNEINRVKISLGCVFAFMAIGWPLIIWKTGIIGWIKFWLMPWLGYHFWMSTFTMVHHTAPHIPFKTSDEWNAAQAQLNGTVHCDYPSWIEVLCHDINVHIPHHISPRIPSYNLRAAHQSLQENWGKHLNEASWNWRLMKTILTICHVYDKERNYVAFDEIVPEEAQPITFLKKVMPDYA